MDDKILEQLQKNLAIVDSGIYISGCKNITVQGVQLIKLDSIKIKMYKENNHNKPHIHIDYKNNNHVASFELYSGDILSGNIDNKYSKIIKNWILENNESLVSIWNALKNSQEHDVYIKTLIGTIKY
jgi:hypothetical protein